MLVPRGCFSTGVTGERLWKSNAAVGETVVATALKQG